MTDPFQAVHADLKKTVRDLRVTAKVKYDHAQKLNAEAHKAGEESEQAVDQWKSAEKRLTAFLGEGHTEATPKKAASAKKKAVAKKTVAKKKGKKKGKKKAAPAKKAVAKKKGKAKAKKTAAKKTVTAKSPKERPVWREAMAIVMGKEAMDAATVLAGLTERGWKPNAGDPRQYVSFMLSSNKETFQRVEGKRGVYTVRADATFGKRKKGKAKAAAKATVTAKATVQKAATKASDVPAPKASNSGQVEAQLADIGIEDGNVATNPFTG